MAINAYTGLQGHGKSYEVVENVILPALLAGRRVVTNVANLDVEAITAYLVKHHAADPEKIGTIVQVQNDDIPKAGFFPPEEKAGVVAAPSVVQGGDLVVCDEVWRWWATGQKMDPLHMVFFRMHRHFLHPETNVSCDVAVVVQDVNDLNRSLKAVVENTYMMTKLKSLGMESRYRVDIFQKTRMRKPYRQLQRAYKKEIFALYRSYSQGNGSAGKEVGIDGRNNIFKGALFKFVLPLALLFACFASWGVYRFFNPKPKTPAVKAAPAAGTSNTASPSSVAPLAAPSVGADSDWRVVGDYAFSGNHYVIVTRGRSMRTLVNPRGFYFDALRAYGTLDGKQLTNYTGLQENGGGILPGDRK